MASIARIRRVWQSDKQNAKQSERFGRSEYQTREADPGCALFPIRIVRLHSRDPFAGVQICSHLDIEDLYIRGTYGKPIGHNNICASSVHGDETYKKGITSITVRLQLSFSLLLASTNPYIAERERRKDVFFPAILHRANPHCSESAIS
jgi:hypothetical protein